MKTIIKKYSYILMPLIVFIACILIEKSEYNIFTDCMYKKIETLAGISGSILSILIAILTIYISLPDNEKIYKLKQTEHSRILINNIATGILLFSVSIVIWILNLSNFYSIVAFLCALGNLFVTIYYIITISKYI